MTHRAQCHCGNIVALFDTALSFEVLGVRECKCSFCQKHKALYITDPQGKLSITVNSQSELNQYSFATKTIEFLVCRTCGVCIAATFLDEGKRYGVLNARTFDDTLLQLPEARFMDYDTETTEERVRRRRTYWTPMGTLNIG